MASSPWQSTAPSRRFSIDSSAQPRGSVAAPAKPAGKAPAPWAQGLADRLRQNLGDSPAARTVIQLASAHLAESTQRSYGTAWTGFLQFCEAEQRQALPADGATIALYLGHLKNTGKWQPQSVGPVLSAINKVHLDVLGSAAPTDAPLIKQMRNGWEYAAAQEPEHKADQRQPFPAEAALGALRRFISLNDAAWQVAPDTARALVFAVLGFCQFARAGTDIGLRRSDVSIANGECVFRFRVMKGHEKQREFDQQRFSGSTGRLLAPHITRWQSFQLDQWSQSRRTMPATVGFYQLPSDSSWPPPGGASSACNAWLALACRDLNVTAPLGGKFTSHSLRKGGASAAYAIDVNIEDINFHGGWAAGSDTAMKHYIDRSIRASDAARALLGFLLRR
jgi:hypothetical protein